MINEQLLSIKVCDYIVGIFYLFSGVAMICPSLQFDNRQHGQEHMLLFDGAVSFETPSTLSSISDNPLR